MGDPNKVTLRKVKSSKSFKLKPRTKSYDSSAVEELVQCGICLERPKDSRMLPCQHTFCLFCLQSHHFAKNLGGTRPSIQELQQVTAKQKTLIKCPICQTQTTLENGFDSLETLPRNLYIETLLKVLEGGNTSPPIKTPEPDCSKCHTFIKGQQQCCLHCIKVFCRVCWSSHLGEMESNLAILVRQVEESKMRLAHKLENFEKRCDQLSGKIREGTVQKIEEIRNSEKGVLDEVVSLVHQGKINHDHILADIEKLKEKLELNPLGNDGSKVSNFMLLHRETSNVIKQVGHFAEAHMIFDPNSFKLDQDTEGIYQEIGGETLNGSSVANPLESTESMLNYYKTRSFAPKLIWNRCPRPANVGVPPWDQNLVYITATDTHTVLILNREHSKVERRLTSPEMLYPQGIAFSAKHQEIYISDKWKHCVHVFSHNGDYLRALLSKGSGPGRVRIPDGLAMTLNEDLVISDSGNDRIITIDPQTGEHLLTIGVANHKTSLNMPTGIACVDNCIVVADTGNHRIKIFDLTGKKLHEFGALGRGRGQFRSAEVVAVDPMGFILVGDGGNARIQIFKSDGTLVKIVGGNDWFGWVSGIFVTDDFDIITTDSKMKSLKIF